MLQRMCNKVNTMKIKVKTNENRFFYVLNNLLGWSVIVFAYQHY